MNKSIYWILPFFLAGIIVFCLTNRPTPPSSFQITIPQANLDASLKKTVNAAVVEIKRDNVKVNLETPLTDVSLTNINNEYVYTSQKDYIDIKYKPIAKGIKEEIILHQLPDLTKLSEPDSDFVEFSLTMFLDNLTVGTNADNLPIFFDQQTGKYQFHFQKPFAKDAKGETTTSLVYEILPDSGPSLPPKIQTMFPYLKPAIIRTQKASRYLAYLGSKLGINSEVLAQSPSAGEGGQRKKYTLVLGISKAWLSDPKRAFPITIDPSVVYDPGNSKPEIIERRTATSRTFAKGDGSLIGIFTTYEQNYKDENGTWQKVNENLGDNEDFDGFAYSAKEMKHKLKVGGNGERKWYPRRNVKDEYITIGKPEYLKDNDKWQSLPLGEIIKTRRQISWENENYSLRFFQSWNRIKFDLVLKNQNAPTSFRWLVGLNNLTWDEWKIKAKDEVVAEVSQSTAFDANGEAVPLNVSHAGDYIVITADISGKTFPITIDPPFTTPQDNTIGCNYVYSGAANYNYGAAILVYSGVTSYKGLLRFDLSSIPVGSTCDVATLSMWSGASASTQTFSIYEVSAANGDWVEGTKTNATAGSGESCWNQKAYGSTNWAGSAGLSTAGTDYNSVSIGTIAYPSNLVNAEAQGSLATDTVATWFGVTNSGIAIFDGGAARYWHSDDSGSSTRRPKLYVEYTEASPSPTPAGQQEMKFEKIQMEGIKID